ncbi:hemolysin family protein [Treponema phagedenis]|uniref:hemolysin family protein n=1 Tax=Treponema phagedenis TaxID=162 RepID=UPI0001F63FB0|nr:hemolysin family protein [Treponema phagedenis]EFW37169.1 hypothetical protein HMPREF9554_02357 [Treponema phagedenis F0421]TYT78694.1 HlyC/CorC family transporter [Treponema phagedenis]
MSIQSIIIIIETIILIVCAGFFAGTETAITAIGRADVRKLSKQKQKSSVRLTHLVRIKDRIVTTTLIYTNFINMLASALITAFTIEMFGNNYLFIATIITTSLIILFAEIIPKAVCAYYPVLIGKRASAILYFFYILLYPVVLFFSGLSGITIKLFSGTHKKIRNISEEELKALIKISTEDGAVKDGENYLLSKATRLRNLKLRNIMTTRTDIIAVEHDVSIDEIMQKFRESRFSRLPVYDKTNDSIIGIIHYKDVLFYKTAKKHDSIISLIRETTFVPETSNVFSVIKAMKNSKHNMAIVIDEHGGTAGLITMDDIIAAVFGTIQDEYGGASVNYGLRLIGKSRLHFSGEMPIAKLNEILHAQLSSEYYDTMGGLLLEAFEQLPAPNSSITINGILFTVKKVMNRQITSIIADIPQN